MTANSVPSHIRAKFLPQELSAASTLACLIRIRLCCGLLTPILASTVCCRKTWVRKLSRSRAGKADKLVCQASIIFSIHNLRVRYLLVLWSPHWRCRLIMLLKYLAHLRPLPLRQANLRERLLSESFCRWVHSYCKLRWQSPRPCLFDISDRPKIRLDQENRSEFTCQLWPNQTCSSFLGNLLSQRSWKDECR